MHYIVTPAPLRSPHCMHAHNPQNTRASIRQPWKAALPCQAFESAVSEAFFCKFLFSLCIIYIISGKELCIFWPVFCVIRIKPLFFIPLVLFFFFSLLIECLLFFSIYFLTFCQLFLFFLFCFPYLFRFNLCDYWLFVYFQGTEATQTWYYYR